jgi:predicted flap endonuclease-1-like 5' DNA nuclease
MLQRTIFLRPVHPARGALMEATHAMTKLPETSAQTPYDAGKALSFPIGMASPLWMAFAGAAATGAAFWWMSRWTRATNLEALIGAPAEVVETVIEISEPAAELAAEAIESAATLADVLAEPTAIPPMAEGVLPGPVVETVAEAASEAEAVAEPAAEPAPAADDLTRIVGIGPKLSAALAERGLTRFAQLAALQAADLERLDQALDLKGRAVRDAWVAQAARFAEPN